MELIRIPVLKVEQNYLFLSFGCSGRRQIWKLFHGQSHSRPLQQPMKMGQPISNAAASSVIEQSSENARLIVFGSAAFIDDVPLQLSANLTQDYYLNNLLLMQNAVDWSVEDTDLLTIRSRGSATRVLASLTDEQKTGWEIGMYISQWFVVNRYL